jgi:hypothetical protein
MRGPATTRAFLLVTTYLLIVIGERILASAISEEGSERTYDV